MVYAVLLYGVALLQYSDISRGGTSAGLMNLGRGKDLFYYLVIVQAGMIMVLLPPITSGALTIEKEKDTLALLLLTKLSPWTIVFEKLLSRVFAMGTFQLLSLPLFAIIYGMGGVELDSLVIAIAGLLSLTVLVASISILCSAWFRTTSAAFVMTFILQFCFLCVFGPVLLIDLTRAATSQVFVSGVTREVNLALAGIVAIIFCMSGCVSLICLFIASKILVLRAFLPARNLVLEIFRHADHFFSELNNRTTGGIILVPDRDTLPLFHPIAWRETRKKSLGTFRYQFRILMLLLAPLIFAIAYVMQEGRNDFTSPFRTFPVFFWVVSIICLTIHSTAAIPAERTRQTLDVLLVIPASSTEIVHEKLAGVRRLIMILSVPFTVLVIFQAIWTGYVVQGLSLLQNTHFLLELLATALAALIYMPLIMWIGFQFGLRMRTQMRAVLSTFVVVGAMCAVPALFFEATRSAPLSLGETWGGILYSSGYAIRWLSPVQIVLRANNLFGTFQGQFAWLVLGFHFAFYAVISLLIRRNALRSFSRIVGRMEPGPVDEPVAHSIETVTQTL